MHWVSECTFSVIRYAWFLCMDVNRIRSKKDKYGQV